MKNLGSKLPAWSLGCNRYEKVKDLVIKDQIHCDPADMKHEALRYTSKSPCQQLRLEQQPVVRLDPLS